MSRYPRRNQRRLFGFERLEPRQLMTGGGINPQDFVSTITNPFLPYIPGTTFTYQGRKDQAIEINRTFVTHQKKDILGVDTTVVLDVGYLNGKLEEKTYDWYAQDKQGNVWYFGEDSKQYKNGVVVSTAGSWEAGVNGAQPGIIMEANPEKGDTYRQEFAADVAQDMATVLSLQQKVIVPYGAFDHVLQTKEFSPLEPRAVEHKYYARGIGLLESVDVTGGNEVLLLTNITHD